MNKQQLHVQVKTHPAAQWAAAQEFDTTDIDCMITVVLKILDGKCKMLPGEKAAIMAIYDVVNSDVSEMFSEPDRQLIYMARKQHPQEVLQRIHELRVYAETEIPKPVMKRYKARLRDGLFG